jgi:hypothetical protein
MGRINSAQKIIVKEKARYITDAGEINLIDKLINCSIRELVSVSK